VLVPAHGDFHAGQLLRRADELLVVDTDALCRAVPSLDLAEYVAAATEADASPWDATEAVADRLFEGYGGRPPGFRWHLAAAILVRASHPFHRLEPGWPERTARLVELAERFAPARSRKA
jgi:hypothetical protein